MLSCGGISPHSKGVVREGCAVGMPPKPLAFPVLSVTLSNFQATVHKCKLKNWI